MKRVARILLGGVVLVAILVLIGPLVVPIRPLTDVVLAEQLTDPDRAFIALNGLTVHYQRAGTGEPCWCVR